jgi:hypothetical protein
MRMQKQLGSCGASVDPFLERIDRKFDALGKKLDRGFRRLVALEITNGIVAVTSILWGR